MRITRFVIRCARAPLVGTREREGTRKTSFTYRMPPFTNDSFFFFIIFYKLYEYIFAE